MEVSAGWYRLEAAPTTHDALCYHADPDLAFGLEVLAVSALGLCAARLVCFGSMCFAVAPGCYLWASALSAYLPGVCAHHSDRDRLVEYVELACVA